MPREGVSSYATLAATYVASFTLAHVFLKASDAGLETADSMLKWTSNEKVLRSALGFVIFLILSLWRWNRSWWVSVECAAMWALCERMASFEMELRRLCFLYKLFWFSSSIAGEGAGRILFALGRGAGGWAGQLLQLFHAGRGRRHGGEAAKEGWGDGWFKVRSPWAVVSVWYELFGNIDYMK